MVFSDEDKILIKKSLYLKGIHSKEVDRRISWEKLDKQDVNKLLKKLPDTGTVDGHPGSGRPRGARTKENSYAFICLNISNILLTHKYTQHTQLHTQMD